MIHSSLLRIGNIVQFVGGNGQPYFGEVIAIDNLKITLDNILFEGVSQATSIVDYSQDEVFGVPLTEEILLACGFEKCSNGVFNTGEYKLWNIILGLVAGGNNQYQLCFCGKWTQKIFNSLHEIQNVFHAIELRDIEIDYSKFKTATLQCKKTVM